MAGVIESQGGTQRIHLKGRAASELTTASVSATVEEGPDRGKLATLSGASLTVGTDPGNDLALTDSAVSRRHAVITVTPEGVQVEDLGSTNGTWLNGTRIKTAFAADGAIVKVGGTRFKLRVGTRKMVVMADEEESFEGLLGRSPAMREIFALVRQLGRTNLPVAVTGETGTGKELVGRALHAAGPRRARGFQVLDCGSLLPELLRSELFGHEKGAFTGAVDSARGILEAADGGTVFLDEVGEIDPAVQPALLRALETREVTRIGSRKVVPVDVRVVSATNRDLAQAVEDGGFRRDLFYRLSCFTIRLPPLRERVEDIPLLAERFLADCMKANDLPATALTADGTAALLAHGWPGNVRELKNVVQIACVLADGRPVGADAVRRALAGGARPSPAAAPAAAGASQLETLERAAIVEALEATDWNRKAAARKLGIAASTIFDKIKRYGLKPASPRKG
jgi:DNA-binding NtrC family response regulator